MLINRFPRDYILGSWWKSEVVGCKPTPRRTINTQIILLRLLEQTKPDFESNRSWLITATCTAISADSRILWETGTTLNKAALIAPVTGIQQSMFDTGKTLKKLIDYYTDYWGASRTVKVGLEIKVLMRGLVLVHFADVALVLHRHQQIWTLAAG